MNQQGNTITEYIRRIKRLIIHPENTKNEKTKPRISPTLDNTHRTCASTTIRHINSTPFT